MSTENQKPSDMPAGTENLRDNLSIQIHACIHRPVYGQPMQNILMATLDSLRDRLYGEKTANKAKKISKEGFITLLHDNQRFNFTEHFFSGTIRKDEAEIVLSILLKNDEGVCDHMSSIALGQLMRTMAASAGRNLTDDEKLRFKSAKKAEIASARKTLAECKTSR